MRQRPIGMLIIGLAFVLVLGLSLAAPTATAAEPICTCRYAGQSFMEGVCVCMVTASGPKTACCDKVLNNPSWTFTRSTCPMASLPNRTLSRTPAIGDSNHRGLPNTPPHADLKVVASSAL